jgi:hypothetical protein
MLPKMARALLAVAASVLAVPAPAQDAVREDNQEAVESLLAAAEVAAGRAFDRAFREEMRLRLSSLSVDELAERRQRVGTFGLGEPHVPGDPQRDLVFTPVPPCRIANTRNAGGTLAPGVARAFRLTGVGLDDQGGEAAGCGVPFGPATAAVVNFVAVNVVGAGNLRAWAYSTPPADPPTASVLNYASVPGLNIANGIVVPLCSQPFSSCPNDLRVQADVSGTHLVMDVVGYFHRLPVERIRSFVVADRTDVHVAMAPSCTSYQQVVVNAPVAGKVIVQALLGFNFVHTAGIQDYLSANIATANNDCTLTYRWLEAPGTPAGIHQNTASFVREFPVAAGQHTFHLNAVKGGTAPSGDFLFVRTLVATFYPN